MARKPGDEKLALAAVKAAKVRGAKTFAEADRRMAAARRGFAARKAGRDGRN